MDKIDFRTLSSSAQEAIRKRAVAAVLDGQRQKEADDAAIITLRVFRS